jgi:outer membrane biosynthesis protein TonB
MDRAEAAGLGVAAVGHLALLAAITYGVAATRLPVPKSDPIEVAFVEETGLESTAPSPSAQMPAPLAGPPELPPAPAMPEPPAAQPAPTPAPSPAPALRPQPQPQPRAATPPPRPQPQPQPQSRAVPASKAVAKPAARPAPAPPKPANARRNAGGLSSVVAGLSDRETPSRTTTPPAAKAGPQVEASLVAEVRRQLKPHWKAPTGADAEQLRTEVILSLGANGQVTDISIVGTSGQTASNRPQVPLHREQAERAIRLAAPFRLPAQYYEAWKQLRITFDKRL